MFSRFKLVAGFFALSSLALLLACGEQAAEAEAAAQSDTVEPVELVVYSARKEHLLKPLFDRFTAETGIAVSYVTDKAGPLLARLQAEGANSPADVLITVDAGNLWAAAERGVLAPVASAVLEANVPAHLRDAGNRWFAMSIRARTIVYASDRVDASALSSYEALAADDWKGRLCLRTSKKVYNQSLVATMIAADGTDAAKSVVEGWVANLAMAPFSNDTKVMQAIAAGQCDAGIVNTYYYGRLMKEQPELKLSLFWPNQPAAGVEGFAARGVHINISGAGITAHSKHAAEAQQLLEWMSADVAQQIVMELNQEYPVLPTTQLLPELAAWGEFVADDIDVSEAGRRQAEAIMLMDVAGYR